MSIQSEITRISNNVQNTIDVIEQTGVSVPAGANSDTLPSLAQSLANEKQDKLTGTQGQIVGFDASGNAQAQSAPTPESIGAISNSSIGEPNGIAELDANGLVPASQLPGFVDDVIDAYIIGTTPYAQDWLSRSSGGSPLTPTNSAIYIIVSPGDYQNQQFRWSGTQYAEISSSLALGETMDTAYRGDRGKIAYDHSQTMGNPHGTTAADVGALTQDGADTRYLQMQGTTTVAESIGAGPFTIEFTEETEDIGQFLLTFGAQSVATSAWAADTTYEGWGFRAAVALSGVTADYVPSVTFGIVDATSGNLAPVADTYAGGVYIYAKEQPTAAVSIASVVCCKGV